MATSSAAPTTSKEWYGGHDVKSLAVNVATTALFVLPLLLYKFPSDVALCFAGVGVVMGLAYLVPPVGWKRPHPYSDNPENRPRKML